MREVSLTIDGRKVTATVHEPALRVAERNGIAVPTLCDHPALEPYGACRLCLVEVTHKNRTRLVTACNFPVEEGLEIHTSSDQVRRHRKMVLEMLLARCPEVPELRELAAKHGIEQPRFNVGEETCILCGLCTRVCETYSTSAISMLGRGDKKRLEVYANTPPADCVGCGACAALCPTGHITDSSAPGSYHIWNRELPLATCQVDATKCRGCGACEEACPFSAPRVVLMRDRASTSTIDIAACRGCGVCIAACPSAAIVSPRANRTLPALPTQRTNRRILAVACARANLGGPGSPALPEGVVALELPCSGGVSPAQLLGGLAIGFDAIVVLGRHQPSCRLEGAEDHARKTVQRMERLARLIGLGTNRIRFIEPAPGPTGPIDALQHAQLGATPSPLAEPLSAEQLTDSLDSAWKALTWLSQRPELMPDAVDWLAEHGLPPAIPGRPILLADVIPYLDLLLDEWLGADSLADQLIDGLAVLRALGCDAGVLLERWQIDFAALTQRYPDSEIYALSTDMAIAARNSGSNARSLVEILTERGEEIAGDGSKQVVAVSGTATKQSTAVESLGLEQVAVEPVPQLEHWIGITPHQHHQLEQRLVDAGKLRAHTLLLDSTAELAQHLIVRRQGSWRRSHVRPTLIGGIAASGLGKREALP